MATKFQVINIVLKLSELEFKDEVILVFKRKVGDYSFCLESLYAGDEESVCGRYLNGKLAPE